MTSSPLSALGTAAAELAALGFRVFPLSSATAGVCSCRKRDKCNSPGKHPRIGGWQHQATTDANTLRGWWERWSDANIGLATGGALGLVVVDVDGDAGRAAWSELEAEHGPAPTLRASTGRPGGGEHRYYRLRAEHDASAIKNKVSFAPGLDVRAEGGLVVAPPSLHGSGAVYAWSEQPSIEAIAVLPDWLFALLADAARSTLTAPRSVTREQTHADRRTVKASNAPPYQGTISAAERERRARSYLAKCGSAIQGMNGSRTTLVTAEKILRGFHLDEEAAARLMLEDYNPRCEPPWTEEEIRRKVSEATKCSRPAWGVLLEERGNTAQMHHTDSATVLPSEKIARGAISAEAETPIALAQSRTESDDPFSWMSTTEIFAPLPPTNWIVRDLQLCAGRPSMLAGYGYSGKTLAAQALALAAAAGLPVWGRFPVSRKMVVRHVDHDQGRATLRRYQRLARGMGIDERDLDNRLQAAILPPVYLNQPGVLEAYRNACEGVDLLIIDAFRGAIPGEDENDSKIRRCVDVLSQVSELTGTACVLIHHAAKPRESHTDNRTLLRGSSAIYDGCGSVFALVAADDKNGPKHITHLKSAAEAESGLIEPFYLVIDEVKMDPMTEGSALRVLHRSAAEMRSAAPSPVQNIRTRILEHLRTSPEASKRDLRKLGGGQRNVDSVVDAMVADGLIQNRGTKERSRYFLCESTDAAHKANDAEPSSYEQHDVLITKNPTEGAP
ncbi:bifunctional DNA primase/polymerase [Sorangium sp. So ce381]|uniref:bifunctional DNA primase/polymerase n=1 Tax=Sorangium sp. So ce381 TaxID=3133307 RepID=UPI003F5BCF76